jgi:hypothetical protein
MTGGGVDKEIGALVGGERVMMDRSRNEGEEMLCIYSDGEGCKQN